MNNDKHAWLTQAENDFAFGLKHHSSRDSVINALDDALKARLMHVAIGFASSPSQPTRLLIDLSVYVFMESRSVHKYFDVARSGVMLEAKRHSYSGVAGEYGFIEQAKAGVILSDVCRTLPLNPYSNTLSSPGEALTLHLLFDTYSEHSAHAKAAQICDRFTHWDNTETTLSHAVKAIQSTIVDAKSGKREHDALSYKTAEIRDGWHTHIANQAHLIMPDIMQFNHVSQKLPDFLKDFCLYRFEETWNEAARQSGLLDNVGVSEPKAGSIIDEVANDYVSAERLMSMIFGKRERKPIR